MQCPIADHTINAAATIAAKHDPSPMVRLVLKSFVMSNTLNRSLMSNINNMMSQLQEQLSQQHQQLHYLQEYLQEHSKLFVKEIQYELNRSS